MAFSRLGPTDLPALDLAAEFLAAEFPAAEFPAARRRITNLVRNHQ